MCLHPPPHHADACEEMKCTHGSKCVAAPDGKASCQCIFECHAEATEKLCGTDGRTYRNRCEFDQRLCSHQDDIYILREGPCGTNAFATCQSFASTSEMRKQHTCHLQPRRPVRRSKVPARIHVRCQLGRLLRVQVPL